MGTRHSGTNLAHPVYYPWFPDIDSCQVWAPTCDVTINILCQPFNGHRDILLLGTHVGVELLGYLIQVWSPLLDTLPDCFQAVAFSFGALGGDFGSFHPGGDSTCPWPQLPEAELILDLGSPLCPRGGGTQPAPQVMLGVPIPSPSSP